jgi:hypothetical protein
LFLQYKRFTRFAHAFLAHLDHGNFRLKARLQLNDHLADKQLML